MGAPAWAVCRSSVGTDLLPGRVRIELRHRSRLRGRARAEVLLVQYAVMVDQEGHHPGVTVLDRPCHDRKTANQPVVRDVVERAARRMLALGRQQLVVVAVVALPAATSTFTARRVDGWSKRARLLARLGIPV